MRRTHIAKPRLTKSRKAGIIFPAARIWRNMKKSKFVRVRRVSSASAVYTAAVLEYLTSEIAEIAGDFARKDKKRILTPRHIMFAIAHDVDLHEVLKTVTIPFSGVVPQLHKGPLPSHIQQKKATRKAPTSRATVPKTPVSTANAPSSVIQLSTRKIGQHTSLVVLQGDITKTKADAAVHPTGGSLYLGGQVGAALSRRGGTALKDELASKQREIGQIPHLGVCITRAPGIAAKFLIHCNGPSWNSQNSVSDLIQAIGNCLTAAEAEGYTSIAFPSIGSGGAGFPKDIAARTILSAIKAYIDANPASTTLKEVYFVLYDPLSVQIYTTELNRL